MTSTSSSRDMWTDVAFSEAVQINPGVGLNAGRSTPLWIWHRLMVGREP